MTPSFPPPTRGHPASAQAGWLAFGETVGVAGSTLASDPISITVEVMRIRGQHLKAPVGNFAAVQVGRRGRNANTRIRSVTVALGLQAADRNIGRVAGLQDDEGSERG